MSVPVRRQTHGKTRRRRAHHALKKVVLSVCSKCKKAVQPHRACGFCGHYGDKQVLSTARQSERALRRTQAAAEAKPASPSAKATEDKPAEDKPAEKTKSKTAKKTEDKKEA